MDTSATAALMGVGPTSTAMGGRRLGQASVQTRGEDVSEQPYDGRGVCVKREGHSILAKGNGNGTQPSRMRRTASNDLDAVHSDNLKGVGDESVSASGDSSSGVEDLSMESGSSDGGIARHVPLLARIPDRSGERNDESLKETKPMFSAVSRMRNLSRFGSDRMKPVLNEIATGCVLGLLSTIFSLSWTAAVFVHPTLLPFRSLSVASCAIAAFIMKLVMTTFSPLKHSVCCVEIFLCPFYAMMAAQIADTFDEMGVQDPMIVLTNVLATFAFSTVISGVCIAAAGYLKAGRIINIIPYPVVSGFLASVGLMVISTGLSISAGVSLGSLQSFVSWTALTHGTPAIVLAAALKFLNKRFHNSFVILPLVTTVVSGAFFAILILSGHTRDDARDAGWLLSSSVDPNNRFWEVFTISIHWSQVRWDLLASMVLPTSALMVSLSFVKFALVLPGCERSFGVVFDHNAELKLLGIGNCISGLVGGPVGATSLGLMTMTHQSGATTRLPCRTAMLFDLFLLLCGAVLVENVPKFVFGSLCVSTGWGIVEVWAVAVRSKVSKIEYGVVVVMMVMMVLTPAPWNILCGFTLGMGATSLLFVVQYAKGTWFRVKRVRRSRCSRPPVEIMALDQSLNKEVGLVKLDGHMFFGSASQLLHTVDKLLSTMSRLRFVILDFSLVVDIDSTGACTIEQLVESGHRSQTEGRDITYIITGATEPIRQKIQTVVSRDLDESQLAWHPSIDHAVEHCENMILAKVCGCQDREPSPTTAKNSLVPSTSSAVATAATVNLSPQGSIPNPLSLQMSTETRTNSEVQSWTNEMKKEQFAVFVANLVESNAFPGVTHRLASLWQYVQPIVLPEGFVMYREGDPMDRMYFVESGEIESVMSLGPGSSSLPSMTVTTEVAGGKQQDKAVSRRRADSAALDRAESNAPIGTVATVETTTESGSKRQWRLVKLSAPTAVGACGFLDRAHVTTTVVDGDCHAYVLLGDEFAKMEMASVEGAMALYKLAGKMLAQRYILTKDVVWDMLNERQS